MHYCIPNISAFILIVLVALVSGLTVLTPLLENPLAILLGEASYSLYLVHGFFMPGSHPSKIRYILCVVGCIVSSIILYAFLEKPARKIRRKLLCIRPDLKSKSAAYSGPVRNEDAGSRGQVCVPNAKISL
jgi:peptidoglycan/LPS O-acetylase OafA/YrhL